MKKLILLPIALLLLMLAIRCTKETIETRKDPGTSKETGYMGLDAGGTGGMTGGTTSGSGTSDSTQHDTIPAGQITAAEWNDLMNWDFWLNLGQNEEFNKAMDNWKFYPQHRYSFLVKDENQNPITDCEVTLKNNQGDAIWKARTDNEGKAELWLSLNGGDDGNPTVAVTYSAQEVVIVDPVPFGQGINEVTLNVQGAVEQQADILFVVDATGSMGDEIEYLKSELMDVITQVKNGNSSLNLRLGCVFYRDEGDEFLTRVSPFSGDVNQTLGFINNQHANGGGDYEEAVHTALSTAVTQLSWSEHARARLLFLVLDAPPHHTDPIVTDLNQIIQQTAEKGIKMIPVSASGVNKDTEFLFRFFAAATNGTYVFITNDSGIGGDHIAATVGNYEVELLNALMVRLINKYTK
jgi:hypothetical protein